MTGKRIPTEENDRLLGILVRKRVLTKDEAAEVVPAVSATRKIQVTPRVFKALLGLRSQAAADLGGDVSISDVVDYIDARIVSESAPALGESDAVLMGLERQRSELTEWLTPAALTAIRSYLGEASLALSRPASTSDALDYMIERLARGRTKPSRRRKSQG